MKNQPKTQELILEILVRAGSASVLDLIELGALFDRTPGAVRTAVHRMEQYGLIRRVGDDPVKIKLSDQGLLRLRPLGEKIDFLHRASEGALNWDGVWRAVAFEVPEPERAGRDGFRRDLIELGFRKLVTGLWIFPRNLREKVEECAVRRGLARAVVHIETDRIDFPGNHAPVPLARKLWRINEVEQHYIRANRSFARFLRKLLGVRNPPSEAETLANGLEFLCRWSRAMADDPFLPIEFLGPGWEGFRSHDMFHQFQELIKRRDIPDRFGIFSAHKIN